jgi:hypothetical protein
VKIFSNLLAKYVQFREKWKILREESIKKYCLNRYGVYCNADKLTNEEMLQVFWKILEKNSGYDVSNFTSNTSLGELFSPRDYDDTDVAFIVSLENIFGFARDEIFDIEPWDLKTFGELADLVIQKAKEKKQRQENQQ